MNSFWNELHRALWSRIQAHPFADAEQAIDFRRKLAAEQHWSLSRTDAAIEQYRRFCFLAVVCEQPVSPSHAIDQVWHLHLTHSRDYWQRYCAQVLQTELHHAPSTGGRAQLHQHQSQYAATLAAYERYFGCPPVAWWPACQEQFSPTSQWRWIDGSRYWLLPRPQWPRWRWPALWAAVSLLLPTLAVALPANPLDWRGGPFLALYLGGGIAVLLVSLYLRRTLAKSAVPAYAGELRVEELGYMAGGAPRMVDALVADGLGADCIQFERDQRRLQRGPVHGEGVRGQLQACVGGGMEPARLIRALRPLSERVAAELIRRGMVLDSADAWRVRLISAVPLLVWVGLGMAKIDLGLERNRPVAFLVILTIVCALVALVMLWRRPRLTAAGHQALAACRLQHSRAGRAPRSDKGELGLAVALVGTSVLATTAYAQYHDLRSPSSASSGCGSDGDGGGGGGGGCGGCGGD